MFLLSIAKKNDKKIIFFWDGHFPLIIFSVDKMVNSSISNLFTRTG